MCVDKVKGESPVNNSDYICNQYHSRNTLEGHGLFVKNGSI